MEKGIQISGHRRWNLEGRWVPIHNLRIAEMCECGALQEERKEGRKESAGTYVMLRINASGNRKRTGYHMSHASRTERLRQPLLSCSTENLHSTLQYLLYNVSCNSHEWSRLRSCQPSSGSYQEFGQRSWSAAGAPDLNVYL